MSFVVQPFTRWLNLKPHLLFLSHFFARQLTFECLSSAGEKKFVCPQCSKRFMRSDHLAKHIKTHLNKKGLNSTAAAGQTDDAAPPDSIIAGGGPTLILTNLPQAGAHDILSNSDLPLQLVTVSANEVME